MLGIMADSQAEGFDRLGELELTLAQVRTLFVVGRAARPLPITVIAERVGLSLTAAGRSVERLVRLHLVSREECAGDRRVKLVALTEAGHQVIRDQLAAKRSALARFVEQVTPEHREALHRALRAALDDLSPSRHC